MYKQEWQEKSVIMWKIRNPQLPRGMQRIRGPFVLVTVLTYVDRPFVQWHSLIRPLYSFPFDIGTFINFTYLTHCYAFFTSYFTFIYRPTRNIFFIPDDAVDWRKLGFWSLSFTIVFLYYYRKCYWRTIFKVYCYTLQQLMFFFLLDEVTCHLSEAVDMCAYSFLFSEQAKRMLQAAFLKRECKYGI